MSGVFDTVLKQVQGDKAHDAADGGNPVKIGGKAATSTPSSVSNGDRVDAFFDANGRQAVFDGNTTLSVDDGGGALTVDGTVTVQDGGGSLTVDGTVAVSGVGGTVIIAGDVNSVSQGNTPHDASDSGNPLKIGGKASASLPTQVTSGDRVDAYFDRNGRQVIWSETMGATDDAVVEGDVVGTVSAKLRGLQKVFGAVGDAAASGAASISAKLRSIATAIGAITDAQVYGVSDGSVIAKLKGIAGGIGGLDVAASQGDSDGSVIAKLKGLLLTVGQTSDAADEDGSVSAKLRRMAGAIGEVDGNPYDPETAGFTVATVQSLLRYLANRREAVVEMHQYKSSVILVPENGTPALIGTADDITEATDLTSPSSLAHGSWTTTPQYIWIPYDAAQRYLLMVVNNFNVSINVEVAGVSWGEVLETATEYLSQPIQATATTIAAGQQAVWSAYGGLGSISALQVLPILDAPWNWLRLTVTPAGDPSSGSLLFVFQYRKE